MARGKNQTAKVATAPHVAMNQIGILMNQIEAFARSRLTLCFRVCERLAVSNGDGATLSKAHWKVFKK
jgi:hypothetical protein